MSSFTLLIYMPMTVGTASFKSTYNAGICTLYSFNYLNFASTIFNFIV